MTPSFMIVRLKLEFIILIINVGVNNVRTPPAS